MGSLDRSVPGGVYYIMLVISFITVMIFSVLCLAGQNGHRTSCAHSSTMYKVLIISVPNHTYCSLLAHSREKSENGKHHYGYKENYHNVIINTARQAAVKRHNKHFLPGLHSSAADFPSTLSTGGSFRESSRLPRTAASTSAYTSASLPLSPVATR